MDLELDGIMLSERQSVLAVDSLDHSGMHCVLLLLLLLLYEIYQNSKDSVWLIFTG